MPTIRICGYSEKPANRYRRVAAGHSGRNHASTAARMRKHGVYQPLADSGSLVLRQHTLGRQVPEGPAVLRSSKADDFVAVRRHPTALRIHGQEKAHPVDPSF